MVLQPAPPKAPKDASATDEVTSEKTEKGDKSDKAAPKGSHLETRALGLMRKLQALEGRFSTTAAVGAGPAAPKLAKAPAVKSQVRQRIELTPACVLPPKQAAITPSAVKCATSDKRSFASICLTKPVENP